MPSYYEPDRTGAASGYRVSDYQRTIFKANQVLKFSSPVFINENFQMLKLGVTNESMMKGVDWDIDESNKCIDDMSMMKVIDPSFSGLLIHSVKILRPFITDYIVQLLFNQLYPASISYSEIERDQGILEVTPELVSNVLMKVEHLSDLLANKTAKLTVQSDDIKLIKEDLSGVNTENRIINEKHDINSVDKTVIVGCQYGSIYDNNIVITNTLTGNILSRDNGDYDVIGLDLFKTKRSSSLHAVYDGIEIKLPMVGEVAISYQAFGNQIDMENLERAAHRLGHIERYLNDNPYLTPSSIAGSRHVVSLSNKIATLEEQMRSLIKTGQPTYGDVETNAVLVRKIISTDDFPHWWNIAKLYHVSGSTENLFADTFRFRFQSTTTSLQFEAHVTVNRDPNFEGKEFDVQVINSCMPTDVLERVAPKLRLIQVMTEGYSGLMLQIGMRLEPLYDTIAIENLSGREGCWLMADTSALPDRPEDTDVLMPDETSVYLQDGEDMYESIIELPVSGSLTPVDFNIPAVINTTDASPDIDTSIDIITNHTLTGADSLLIDLVIDPGVTNTSMLMIAKRSSETDDDITFIGFCDMNGSRNMLQFTFRISKVELTDRCAIVVKSLDDSISGVIINIVGISVKY